MRLKAGDVTYGPARTVEPFAFSAKGLVARSLLDVLGGNAVAGLAVGVVVVDVRIGGVPGSTAPQAGAGRLLRGIRGPAHGIRGPAHDIRGPTHEPFVLIGGHAFPPPLAC